MERINVTQAVRQFSDLLNRVCYQRPNALQSGADK